MHLADHDLIFIIQSEKEMERYLKEHGQNPRDIDRRIWIIHFRATKKRRMGVLNSFFDRLLALNEKRYYLPNEMLVANLYKELGIPYKWNTNTDVVKTDITKSEHRDLDKFLKKYNSLPKTHKKLYSNMGPYWFDEKNLQPIVKYSEFKKRLQRIPNRPSQHQGTSFINKTYPIATSTPKPNSVQKSISRKSFSDISNTFASETSETSTGRTLAANVSQKSGRVPLAVQSTTAKIKNSNMPKIPEQPMVQARVDASEFMSPQKSKETSVTALALGVHEERIVGNSPLGASERAEPTSSSPIDITSWSPQSICQNSQNDLLAEEEEDTPLPESLNNADQEIESTSRSASTSIDGNNETVIDLYRPPLPIVITGSRELAAVGATEHSTNVELSSSVDRIQHVPINDELTHQEIDGEKLYEHLNAEKVPEDAPCVTEQTVPVFSPGERSDCSEDLWTTETSVRIGSPRGDDTSTMMAENLTMNDETMVSPSMERSKTVSPTTDEEIPGSDPALMSRERPIDNSISKQGQYLSRSSINDIVVETGEKTSMDDSHCSNFKEIGRLTPKTTKNQSYMDDCTPKVTKNSSTPRKSSIDSSIPKRILRSSMTESRKSSVDDFMPKAKVKSTTFRKSSTDISTSKRIVDSDIKKSSSKTPSRQAAIDDFSPRVTDRSDSSQKSDTSFIFHRKASRLATNIFCKLKDSNEEEDSVFRDPISQSSTQSRTRRTRTTNSKIQNEKKLKAIIVARGAKSRASVGKTQNDPDVSIQTSGVESPLKPISGFSTHRSLRKLYTDEAVLNEARRRVRKSKRRPSFLPPASSDSEMFLSDYSSMTDVSYSDSTPAPLFESIADKLDSIDLKNVDTKSKEGKSSSSVSPTLFNVEGDCSSQSKNNLSESHSDLKINSTSQFSNNSRTNDERSLSEQCSLDFDAARFSKKFRLKNATLNLTLSDSLSNSPNDEQSSQDFGASQLSKTSHAVDERSNSSQFKWKSLIPNKEKSRTQQSDSSGPSIAEPSRSRVYGYESPTSRHCSIVAEDDDSKMETDNDSPASKSSTEAAVRKYFGVEEPEPWPKTCGSTSSKSPTNALPSQSNYLSQNESILLLQDDSLSEFVVRSEKIKQFLADTINYNSRLDSDDDSSVSKSSVNTAKDGNSKLVRSPKTTSRSASKSGSSTELGTYSSASADIRSRKQSLCSGDDRSLDALINANKFTLTTEYSNDSRHTFNNVSPRSNSSANSALKAFRHFGYNSPPETSQNRSPNYLSVLPLKLGGGYVSPSSGDDNSPKLPAACFPRKDIDSSTRMASNDSPNSRAGKRPFVEEYSGRSRKILSSSAEAFKSESRPPHSGARPAGKIMRKRKKRERNLSWRQSQSNSDSSSEADDNISRRSTILHVPKTTVSESIVRTNPEETYPPVANDEDYILGTKSRTRERKSIHFATDDDDYNTDDIDRILEESLKRRANLKKKSQEKMTEDSTNEPTVDQEHNHSSQTKSLSPNRTSQSCSTDALRKAQWNAMPCSAETASTTADEKLQRVKEMFQKDSFENYTNSLDLSQYLAPEPAVEDSNYISDDDFL